MLILTRRPGEAMHIGENIRITVVDVQGNRVRMGIEAPREVVVDRSEIYERKRHERKIRDKNAGPPERG